MSDVGSDEVRSRLEAQLAATEVQLRDLERDHDGVVPASREADADDEHDPEGATIAFERQHGRERAPAFPAPVVAELVVMVGLQGSGKSTWVQEHLVGTHAVVSKDHWPRARRREQRQQRVVAELLAQGRDVVVDNTNPTVEDRAGVLALARGAGVRARAVLLDVPFEVCVARNAAREVRAQVPLVGLLRVRRLLVPPSVEEGFASVEVVPYSG